MKRLITVILVSLICCSYYFLLGTDMVKNNAATINDDKNILYASKNAFIEEKIRDHVYESKEDIEKYIEDNNIVQHLNDNTLSQEERNQVEQMYQKLTVSDAQMLNEKAQQHMDRSKEIIAEHERNIETLRNEWQTYSSLR